MIGEPSTPKSPTEKIDIFYTKVPERSYEEIAKIEVGDTDDNWNLKQFKIKARELGANGAIIIGRVGSYSYGTDIGTTNVTIGAGEGYGLVAIAINYKLFYTRESVRQCANYSAREAECGNFERNIHK